MAKPTFLDIVQRVLNDMSGDQVNSWADTIESEQVGYIVEGVCTNMWANRDWDHMRKLIDFQDSGVASRPTHVIIPDNVKRIASVNYNCARFGEARILFKPMRYCEPDDFLRVVNGRNTDSDKVDIILDTTGVKLLINNNIAPSYYTSFDDQSLVFDSYDNTVDTTIQESKIQALGYVIPNFQREDHYIPELPLEAFPALIEESISRAQLKLNQFQDVKSEDEARRQQRWLSRNAWRTNGEIDYPDYGRRGRKSYTYRTRKTHDY